MDFDSGNLNGSNEAQTVGLDRVIQSKITLMIKRLLSQWHRTQGYQDIFAASFCIYGHTKSVHNRIAAVTREMCAGQSSIHALANHLDGEGFWNRI